MEDWKFTLLGICFGSIVLMQSCQMKKQGELNSLLVDSHIQQWEILKKIMPTNTDGE